MKKTMHNIFGAGLAGSLLLIAGAGGLYAQAMTDSPMDAAATAPAPVATPSAVQERGSDEAEDVVLLDTFHVRTSKERSYLGSETTAGTRIVADIIEVPFSIQTLSKDFMDDFQLFSIDEQAAYIGGMAPGDPATGIGGSTLRGYSVPYFRNGFRRTQQPESNSIRQMEVVRGPQSALFGRAAPGGVVNFLSKKPQTKFKTGATAIYGSYDYQRASAYVTGPLVRGKLYYRIDAEYYDFERNSDFYFDRTVNYSGGITYKISQDTSVSIEFEHTDKLMNDYVAAVTYIDRSGADLIRIPIYLYPDEQVAERLMKFNANGSERRNSREVDSYYVQLEHRFAPDVNMRVNFGYSKRNYWRHSLSELTTWDPQQNIWGVQSGDPTQKGYRSSAVHYEYDYDEYGVQIDFTKNWRTAIKQQSLLTFDYFRHKQSQMEWELKDDSTGAALKNAIMAMGLTEAEYNTIWRTPDPFNLDPRYSLTPSFSAPGWVPRAGSTIQESMYTGIFDSDLLTYGALLNHSMSLLDDKMYLIGTIRQDFSEIKRQYPLSPLKAMRDATGNVRAMSYSAGVSYALLDKRVVAFVSYGKSFDPNPTVDPNVGEVYGNLRAKGVDGGIKGILRGARNSVFRYTVSLYKITQENETVRNPESENNPNDKSIPYYIDGGSTEGKGLSIEAGGDNLLLRGLSITGNASWIGKDYVKFPGRDDPSKPNYVIGTRALNIPARTLGVALSYRPQFKWVRGFNFGVSYTYATERVRTLYTEKTSSAMASATRYTPPQETWNMFAGYSRTFKKKYNLSMTINVLNVFDDMRITPSSYWPNGREIRGTVRFEF